MGDQGIAGGAPLTAMAAVIALVISGARFGRAI